jgi:hypothetical protein
VENEQGKFEMDGLAAGDYWVQVLPFTAGHDFREQNRNVMFQIPDRPDARAELDLRVEATEMLYGRAVYTDGTPVHPASVSMTLRAATRQEPPDTVGRLLEPDVSFLVSLTAMRRAQLIEVSGGMIEIRDNSGVIARLHISELSKDPERPTLIPINRVGIQF